MTTSEIAHELIRMCQAGQFLEAVQTLYSPDVVSVEAIPWPVERELKGIDKVLDKGKYWFENNEVHRAGVEGPLVAGRQFCVKFTFDVTQKQSGQRIVMEELAVYEVADGKIVREEFIYKMG